MKADGGAGLLFFDEHNLYWKTIIDTMADGLMIVDPNGEIVFANRTLEELSGYRREELIGASCEILGCNACFGERRDGKDKYCALFKGERIRRWQCTFRHRDGGEIHVVKNAAVLRNAEGTVIGGVETLSDISEVRARDQVIHNLRRELGGKDGFHGILGSSPAMIKVFGLVESAAHSDAPVIIYGESGTGKELVASAIHEIGANRGGPFIKVNCSALSESLLESELFGHVKGAFTGASHHRVGRFEAADGGDIFLDEIGDISPAIQVKLLRVLQEREIERVGDHRPVPINVRVLSATNKNLEKRVEEEAFRKDLFYRIGVIPIHLPPLRERGEDIPLLVNAFMNRIRLKTGKPISGVSQEAYELLSAYDWPGNVRELINAIELAFVLCPGGEVLPSHLPARIVGRRSEAAPGECRVTVDTGERTRLIDALKQAGGNKAEAARILGISRMALYNRLKKFGIEVEKSVNRGH
ncbi:MAG: sigma-54 interaction domain-containing protein [Desulfobacterales bacterium]